MLAALVNRNDDIRRLRDKGYALRFDAGHLVVRDLPYLGENRERRIGAIVTKLEFIDGDAVKLQDHQVFFAGGVPHGMDGNPIPNLGGGATTVALDNGDVVVERSFSNKPAGGPPLGFDNFFDKIEHYVGLICAPAIAQHGGSYLTQRCDDDALTDSPFKLHDSMSTRAEIGDLARLFKDDVVAVIGLGGTGAYLLDFLAKTPVREIRGFDGDAFFVHNAYRSPGRLQADELGRNKSDVYAGRYANFKNNLNLKSVYIDDESAVELDGVTFAFVAVDKGSARKAIFDVLERCKIPFIDVGMGLDRKQNALNGVVRVTRFTGGDAGTIRGMRLAEEGDLPDDEYRQNVQISELNALNAALAVVHFKQLRGFYVETEAVIQSLYRIGEAKVFSLP